MSTFPEHGTNWGDLEATLKGLKEKDFDWRRGRVPALVHYFNDEVHAVVKNAYEMFMAENAVGAGKAFPSLQRLLDEIEAMACALFHAPADSGALFTSGGTESILLAVKAAKSSRPTVSKPNIIAGVGAHPALNKAGNLLGVAIRQVPVNKELRTDVSALEDAIDADTIMIFCSAPSFPYGVFDEIDWIAAVAQKRGCWLHVDACWGGFISPFASDLGYRIPQFDFSISGVTSLSADIHKYGYGAKGASVLLYRERRLIDYVKFSCEWVRGRYETRTLAGSGPGGAIAAAWAAIKYLGRQGYQGATQLALETTRQLRAKIAEFPELEVFPKPLESNLFFFVSRDAELNIDAVADAMKERRWYPGRIKQPPGIHHAIAPVHAVMVNDYVVDLAASVALVKREKRHGRFDERSY